MSFTPGPSYSESVASGESEIVTRTFKIHRFDPHPRRKMIIVHGELFVTVTSSLCQMILAEDSREFKKVISLEGLSRDSDTELLINEIIRQCPYIDMSLHHHLGVTIEFVKNRQYDGSDLAITPSGSLAESIIKSNASTPTTDFPDLLSLEGEILSSQASEAQLNEKVDMASMESYVELLYEEDLLEKARGARCIAKLAKCPENLVSISYHETALNALFRTLREDYRKSIDLTTHIMSVCLSYAQFSDFHQLLLTNKICSLTFDLIEFELHRYDKWRLEVARRQDIVDNRSEFPGSAGSFQKTKNDFDKMRLKFAELTRSQDHLLALAFDVILYMSENTSLHPEILLRGIVPMLMDTLGRKNVDLLKVVMKFLKNLSVFLQCKVQMGQLYVTEKVAQLLDANIPNELVQCCLELLFNLSFDTKLRHKMVIFGILSKLAFYIEDSVLESVTRRILYVMSMDRKVRPKFGSILSIIPILLKIHHESRNKAPKTYLDLLGILINLAGNKKCAQVICENDGLISLLEKSFESEDEMVMKIVRNLSNHSGIKVFFAPFISDLARAIRDGTSEDFVLECIGTLANLDLPNIDFCKLLEEFELHSWIHSVLMSFVKIKDGKKRLDKKEEQERDRVNSLSMEVILLTGTCSGDGECVDLLVQDGVLDLLIQILLCKNDPDIKAQVLYVFYKMCHHPGSKQHIQEETQVPKIVLELLQHENDQIQQICEGIMNLFGEDDKVWMDKLKEKRFRIYNEAWIEMTDRPAGSEQDIEDDDPFGFTYGRSKEKAFVELTSSASETLMTEDESGEEGSEIEDDFVSGVIHDRTEIGSQSRSIFDRFKAQYEHEMKAKEQWDQRDVSDDDDDEDEESSLIVESELTQSIKKSARRKRRVDYKK